MKCKLYKHCLEHYQMTHDPCSSMWKLIYCGNMLLTKVSLALNLVSGQIWDYFFIILGHTYTCILKRPCGIGWYTCLCMFPYIVHSNGTGWLFASPRLKSLWCFPLGSGCWVTFPCLSDRCEIPPAPNCPLHAALCDHRTISIYLHVSLPSGLILYVHVGNCCHCLGITYTLLYVSCSQINVIALILFSIVTVSLPWILHSEDWIPQILEIHQEDYHFDLSREKCVWFSTFTVVHVFSVYYLEFKDSIVL